MSIAIWFVGVAVIADLAWSVPNLLQASLAVLNASFALAGGLWCCTGRLRPVGAVYFFFTFTWLGIAPIVQLGTGEVAWGDAYAFADAGRVDVGLCMNLAATIVFAGGGALARYRSRYYPRTVVRTNRHVRGVRGIALHSVAVLLIGIAPIAIRANGGLGTFFVTQDERTSTLADAGLDLANSGGVQVALVTTLPSALATAGALLSIAWLHESRGQRSAAKQVLTWLELALFIGGIIVFANPLSNTRFLSAAAIGSIVLIALRPRMPVASAIFGALALVTIVVLYPLSSVFKSATATASFDPLSAFVGPDFDGFQQVLNALTYVHDIGHTWGIYILSAIGYVVPRAVWSSKAEPASLDVAANAGYSFTNLSLPLHAELYVEFGWAGMILGISALGYLTQRLDAAWLRRDASLMPLVAYLALSMLSIVRGPLGAQVPVYLTVTVVVLLSVRLGTSAPPIAPGQTRLPHHGVSARIRQRRLLP